MKRKQLTQGIVACCGLFLLILDGKTALEGAQTGIRLCLQVVVPSLFPFFLMTTLLTGSLAGTDLSILRPLGILFGMPPGSESILISGFLGGYPAGAQSIAVACKSGSLTAEEAKRLLSFCNNAGPAFLFGMVSAAFPEKHHVWALWGIHVFSAWVVSRMMICEKSFEFHKKEKQEEITLPGALQQSLRAMAMVCGWILVFRVLIAFLDRWVFWLLPKEAAVLLTGLLELSNGCCELSKVADLRIRFVICSVMLAFGGLCVTMQTISVTNDICRKLYFRGKLLQVLFSLTFSVAVMYKLPVIWLAAFLILGYLLRKVQKKSSIPWPLHV